MLFSSAHLLSKTPIVASPQQRVAQHLGSRLRRAWVIPLLAASGFLVLMQARGATQNPTPSPTTASPQPLTLKLQPAPDLTATVYQTANDYPKQVNGVLQAGDSIANQTVQGFFGYDLPNIPNDARILNARLTVMQNPSKFSGDPYKLGRLLIESALARGIDNPIFYLETGRLGATAQPLFTPQSSGTRTVDVTEIVRQEFRLHDYNVANLQFRLRFGPATNGNSIADLADFTPRALQITYVLTPQPTPPPAISQLGKLVFSRDLLLPLFIINSDGTNQRRLKDFGYEAALSPDGNFIAYVALDGVHVMQADGANDKLIPGTRRGEAPTWNPDNKRIAYVGRYRPGTAAGSQAIMLTNLDGSNRKVVFGSNDLAPNSRIAWSPDGSRIAFTASALLSQDSNNSGVSLYFINIDGSGLTNLLASQPLPGYPTTSTTPRYFRVANPAWSPDGSRIAFEAGTLLGGNEGNLTGFLSIYSIKSDGTDVRRLTHDAPDGGASASPSYSPNGRIIAFTSNRQAFTPGRGGTSRIYLMNADTGAIVSLVPHTERAFFASFGPGSVPALAKP